NRWLVVLSPPATTPRSPLPSSMPAVYLGLTTFAIGALARPWMPDRMLCTVAQSSPAAVRTPAWLMVEVTTDAVAASRAAAVAAMMRVLACIPAAPPGRSKDTSRRRYGDHRDW